MPKRHPIKLLPSQGYLRECFDYDPVTGALTWKRRPREHFPDAQTWATWNGRYARKIAGDAHRYRRVAINDARYYAHRIIWKWMTGEEPPDDPDHCNRDKRDNRWSNLRPATKQQQKWNTRLRKDNPSGFRGVRRRPSGRYQARIDGRHLGTFDTPEKASEAVTTAARQQRGDFMVESLYCRPPKTPVP